MLPIVAVVALWAMLFGRGVGRFILCESGVMSRRMYNILHFGSVFVALGAVLILFYSTRILDPMMVTPHNFGLFFALFFWGIDLLYGTVVVSDGTKGSDVLISILMATPVALGGLLLFFDYQQVQQFQQRLL